MFDDFHARNFHASWVKAYNRKGLFFMKDEDKKAATWLNTRQ